MIWCEYGCPIIISGLTHDSQCYSEKGQGCGKWSNHEDFPALEGYWPALLTCHVLDRKKMPLLQQSKPMLDSVNAMICK